MRSLDSAKFNFFKHRSPGSNIHSVMIEIYGLQVLNTPLTIDFHCWRAVGLPDVSCDRRGSVHAGLSASVLQLFSTWNLFEKTRSMSRRISLLPPCNRLPKAKKTWKQTKVKKPNSSTRHYGEREWNSQSRSVALAIPLASSHLGRGFLGVPIA